MTQIGTTNRARRTLAVFVAALSLLPLSACFDFPVPLDAEPGMNLNPRLIGSWACLPSEPEIASDLKPTEDARVLTMQFEAVGSWYRIRIVGLDKQDEDQSWAAYPSRLGNRTVLNAWPVSDLPPTPRKGVTLVAHAWLSANVIQFDLVDPDPLKGSSLSAPEALRKTLLSHRPQAELFSPFLVCARAKVVDPS